MIAIHITFSCDLYTKLRACWCSIPNLRHFGDVKMKQVKSSNVVIISWNKCYKINGTFNFKTFTTDHVLLTYSKHKMFSLRRTVPLQHTSHIQHTVPVLFKLCNSYIMFAADKNIKTQVTVSACDLHTRLRSLNLASSVDTKHSYNHTKF